MNKNTFSIKAIPIDEPTFQEYWNTGYKYHAGYDAGGTAIYHPSDPNTLYVCAHPGCEALVEGWKASYEARSAEIKKLCKKSRKARSKNK